MDTYFNEQQEMLKQMARDFLSTKCPKKLVRELEKDERGYSPELWRQIAELGWLGLAYPEKYGGTDGNFLDLAVIFEETGRACLPAPFLSSVILGGVPVLKAGNEQQKQKFLTGIAQGKLILTMALTELSGSYDAGSILTKADEAGDSFIINGRKLFVPDAQIADYLVCAARNGKGTAEEIISLFLVDAKTPGINYVALKTIGGDRQFEVTFDKVKVPRENLLGGLNKGWGIVRDALQWATVAKCAEAVGQAQQVLEMTVSHANQRVQFGRPIAKFQAVQHHCADMYINIQGMKLITYEAAWRLGEGLPCEKEVAMAKAWVNDAYWRVVYWGTTIHGGVGLNVDHDNTLYFRREQALESTFGTADLHRETVAKCLLD